MELKAALQEPTATLFSTMKEYKKLPVASDDYDILVQKNDHENIIDSALVRVQNTYEKAVNSAFDKYIRNILLQTTTSIPLSIALPQTKRKKW